MPPDPEALEVQESYFWCLVIKLRCIVHLRRCNGRGACGVGCMEKYQMQPVQWFWQPVKRSWSICSNYGRPKQNEDAVDVIKTVNLGSHSKADHPQPYYH